MDIATRQDFLACLDHDRAPNKLDVFPHSKRHLLAVVEEVNFDDFHGPDHKVIHRLRLALKGRESEAALWALVFIDLWHCSNFGGWHWDALLARDRANTRYAIQAAYWAYAESGADGSPVLAAMLQRQRCWEFAGKYILNHAEEGQRDWWQSCVLPLRKRGQT
jgi:hypothetical protein